MTMRRHGRWHSDFVSVVGADTWSAGCALLLGAFLEVHVEKLLRSVLLRRKTIVDPLFQYPGSLSTSARRSAWPTASDSSTSLSYRDLSRIVRIRNRFAHELHGISFARDAEIARDTGGPTWRWSRPARPKLLLAYVVAPAAQRPVVVT